MQGVRYGFSPEWNVSVVCSNIFVSVGSSEYAPTVVGVNIKVTEWVIARPIFNFNDLHNFFNCCKSGKYINAFASLEMLQYGW